MIVIVDNKEVSETQSPENLEYSRDRCPFMHTIRRRIHEHFHIDVIIVKGFVLMDVDVLQFWVPWIRIAENFDGDIIFPKGGRLFIVTAFDDQNELRSKYEATKTTSVPLMTTFDTINDRKTCKRKAIRI